MIGIGFMLGLERATDLPPSTLMSFASDLTFAGSATAEPIYPGNHDILHGSYLHRPDSNDIDMYRFEIAAGQQGSVHGRDVCRTAAELQPAGYVADAVSRERRRDRASHRAQRRLLQRRLVHRVAAGRRHVLSGRVGQRQRSHTIPNSRTPVSVARARAVRPAGRFPTGPGGGQGVARRDGRRAPGTLFDGDADGVPGGVYNFWFRAVPRPTRSSWTR